LTSLRAEATRHALGGVEWSSAGVAPDAASGFTKAHSGTKTADKEDYVARQPLGHAT
jgi:hypothetical protein